MGYNTESTEWPEVAVTEATKALIDRFFSLLDNDDVGVGEELATKVFSVDATAGFGAHQFRGSEQIRHSRDNAWAAVKKRRHEIRKVYVSSPQANDLMFLGLVAMDLRNGKHVEGEFTGRLKIASAETSDPRLELYQVWADTAPMAKALQDE